MNLKAILYVLTLMTFSYCFEPKDFYPAKYLFFAQLFLTQVVQSHDYYLALKIDLKFL